jgi:hypothetical protein
MEEKYCISRDINKTIVYSIIESFVTWRLKAAICPSAGRGFVEHVSVEIRNAPLLDSELLEHVSTATNTTEEAMHCLERRRILGNAYRNVSVHTATNFQSTVTAKNTLNVLLKEVISIRFDQNLPQWEIESKTDARETYRLRQEDEMLKSYRLRQRDWVQTSSPNSYKEHLTVEVLKTLCVIVPVTFWSVIYICRSA